MDLTYDEAVGTGLYAEVWRATDVIGRVVAVKFFQNAGTREEQYALQHAGILARVRHPAIVQLLAVELQPHPDTGAMQTAIIMDYIAGTSLVKTGTLSLDEVKSIGLDMIQGVSAIHRKGAVHGDLHSGNVMIAAGRATLIDMLYTHSLAEVGTKLAQANRDQDILELIRLLHVALSKAPSATALSQQIAHFLVQPPAVLEELEASWTSLFAQPAINAKPANVAPKKSASPVSGASGTNTKRRARSGEEIDAGSLRPEDSTAFFHDRLSEAFPGVSGLYVTRDPSEAVARLAKLLKKPIVVGRYEPIWEVGDGTMGIKSFKKLPGGCVLVGHHRYKVRELVGYRSMVYWRDFAILRWEADEPTGLYDVPSPEELQEWVGKYHRYTEEYGVWGRQLVTRQEYDDQHVFRDGKIRAAPSSLEVRQLAVGAEFIVGQRSPLNDISNDLKRISLLRELSNGRVTYEEVAKWVEVLPKHRREQE